MPNLKDMKIRIESVKSTRKITKAMQMVAAAKLRKAQEAAEEARPYAEKMKIVVKKLLLSLEGTSAGGPMLVGTGTQQIHLLIIATSERGLCGAFNSSIVKMAKAQINELSSRGITVKILTIGKKGREQLKREFGDIMIQHVDLSSVKKISYEDALQVTDGIINRFQKREFDVATIFYNRFNSVISQVPTAEQLIPIKNDVQSNETRDEEQVTYTYEPDEKEIVEDLLPKAICTKVFTALLENGASEQGARMSAMDNATRNAGEMIDKLTIQFNRSRQAAITNELIEIISGAEAL